MIRAVPGAAAPTTRTARMIHANCAAAPPGCVAPGILPPPGVGGLTWPPRLGLRLGAGEFGCVPPPACPFVEPPGEVDALTYDGATAVCWPRSPPGVGSNRSQPRPVKYSSGQACASAVVTSQLPSGCWRPAVKPIATLDGIPISRASTAIAKANCWQ